MQYGNDHMYHKSTNRAIISLGLADTSGLIKDICGLIVDD